MTNETPLWQCAASHFAPIAIRLIGIALAYLPGGTLHMLRAVSLSTSGIQESTKGKVHMIGHLFQSLFHAFFKIVLSLIVCAAIGGAATLVVAYLVLGHWPPSRLTEITAIAIAVLAAYAGAMTALMSEAVRGLLAAARVAEKETFTAGNIVEYGVKAVEHAAEK
jgi:hypothetical protein